MNGMRAVGPWKVYQHPCFVAQVKALRDEVAALKHHFPDDYRNKAATRLLAAINKARKDISADPTQAKYRLGDTLGVGYRHWFRAKFLSQYRLFFRYSLRERIIILILAWVNDSQTKRAYGNRQVSLSLCEPQP